MFQYNRELGNTLFWHIQIKKKNPRLIAKERRKKKEDTFWYKTNMQHFILLSLLHPWSTQTNKQTNKTKQNKNKQGTIDDLATHHHIRTWWISETNRIKIPLKRDVSGHEK